MQFRPLALAALCLVGCGSNPATTWTPADTVGAEASKNAQRDLVVFCSSDAGCTGAQVEVVERTTACNLGSMLQRHGVDQGDAGAGCAK